MLESEIWRCWVHIVGFDGRDIGIRELFGDVGSTLSDLMGGI